MLTACHLIVISCLSNVVIINRGATVIVGKSRAPVMDAKWAHNALENLREIDAFSAGRTRETDVSTLSRQNSACHHRPCIDSEKQTDWRSQSLNTATLPLSTVMDAFGRMNAVCELVSRVAATGE
jgi:hypothetical protein